MTERSPFVYDIAFARNLGWFTEAEQLALRGKRVAIAGMGGVGGVHLLSLARLGIGAFHIADFDTFDLANFNRQVGATMDTIGRPKAEVLDEMARAINPELRIERFDKGVAEDNIESFLHDVDLFVDGFDFFVLGMRRQVFARCAELNIPAVTAAPVGMGTAYLIFDPKGMSFEEYFQLDGQPENEQYLRFLLGLTPKGLHRTYLVDPSRINLAAKQAPSTIAGCQLCAGVTAVMAAKILLGRADIRPAPYHHHYDAYRGKLAISKLAYGNAGPMQRFKLHLARKALAGGPRRAPAAEPRTPQSPIEEILSAARWAPSGDNEQPWRFELHGDQTVTVHLRRPVSTNVYEFRNGQPLLLAVGMLLENLRIAASAHGHTMEWRQDDGGWPDRIVVRFTLAAGLGVDRLYSYLGLRSVDRRRYRKRPLTDQERAALKDALGDRLVLDSYPRLGQRWQIARLSAQATDIRLRAPETFITHRRVIDWQRKLSPSGIPAGTLGLDRPTLGIMRWAMQSWARTHTLNRIAGTGMAALQMDYRPILASAACFTVRQNHQSASVTDTQCLIESGQYLQRFWLTAAYLGLAIQPLLAMLIFSDYGDKSLMFTADTTVQSKATALAASFRGFFDAKPDEFIFMGRVGQPWPRIANCRSVRHPLAELMTQHKAT